MIHTPGTTREGGAYEWQYFQLLTVDEHGLLASVDTFDASQWSEAVTRFDALCAAHDPRSGPVVA